MTNSICYCRLCAKCDAVTVGIFSDEGRELHLPKLIAKHLPMIHLNASPTVTVSSLLCCTACASTLVTWDQFVTSCLDAEKQLHTICELMQSTERALEEENGKVMKLEEKAIEVDENPFGWQDVETGKTDWHLVDEKGKVMRTELDIAPQIMQGEKVMAMEDDTPMSEMVVQFEENNKGEYIIVLDEGLLQLNEEGDKEPLQHEKPQQKAAAVQEELRIVGKTPSKSSSTRKRQRSTGNQKRSRKELNNGTAEKTDKCAQTIPRNRESVLIDNISDMERMGNNLVDIDNDIVDVGGVQNIKMDNNSDKNVTKSTKTVGRRTRTAKERKEIISTITAESVKNTLGIIKNAVDSFITSLQTINTATETITTACGNMKITWESLKTALESIIVAASDKNAMESIKSAIESIATVLETIDAATNTHRIATETLRAASDSIEIFVGVKIVIESGKNSLENMSNTLESIKIALADINTARETIKTATQIVKSALGSIIKYFLKNIANKIETISGSIKCPETAICTMERDTNATETMQTSKESIEMASESITTALESIITPLDDIKTHCERIEAAMVTLKSARNRQRESDRDCVKAAKTFVDGRAYYTCTECRKSLQTPYSFLLHMRIHTGERPYVCDTCGKQFRISQGLMRHVKETHQGLKPYACDLCGRRFSTRRNVAEHRRIHTNERPYVCHRCGKAFKQKASLFVHGRSHTDSFPYRCGHCEHSFRTRPALAVHVARHSDERPHACAACHRRFLSKLDLRRHAVIHSDAKPFSCDACGMTFRQSRYLRRHIKVNH